MTQLSDHAREILRAIADGKQIETSNNGTRNGGWDTTNTKYVLHLLSTDFDTSPQLRVAPETCTINGVTFAAPDNVGMHSLTGWLDHYKWVNMNDRDAATKAIIDALEGRTK